MSALGARRRGTPRDGFLLVEAMAALVLGALILAGLLSLSGLLRRSADRAAWGVEVSEVSKRTVDTIARELRQIARRRWAAPPLAPGATQQARSSQATRLGAPSNAARAQQMNAQAGQADGANGAEGAAETPAAPPRPFVFSGAPDRLTFTLMTRQDTGLRAPQFVAYQIEDGGAVLRSEAPLPADATQAAAIQLGPVARIDPGPERLRFAYVERLASGGEAILDAWADPFKMPAAIRIDRFDARTGQPTGSLRVPLLIDAEAGCAGDQGGLCSRVESGGAGGSANGSSRDPRAPDASGEQQ